MSNIADDILPDGVAESGENLAEGSDAIDFPYRSLAEFNRGDTRPSFAGIPCDVEADTALLAAYAEHGRHCRRALALSPDLHAAAGLVLSEGVERGLIGLVDALELLATLLESRWEALYPPLRESRPAKAWNARKDAVEVLADRALVRDYLLRLPWLGQEHPIGLCWRACIVASGENECKRFGLKPTDAEREHATDARLRLACASLSLDTVRKLRAALVRGAKLLGADGVGATFAQAARTSSEALGAEARGETLGLAPLKDLFDAAAGHLEIRLPVETAVSNDGAAHAGHESGGETAVPVANAGSSSVADAARSEGPVERFASESTPPAPSSAVFSDAGAARLALEGAARRLVEDDPSSPSVVLLAVAIELDGCSFPDIVAALGGGASGSLLDATLDLESRLDRLVFDLDAGGLGERVARLRERELPADTTRPDDRAAALATLDAVARYRREREPASPVGALLERALALSRLPFEQVVAALAESARRAAPEGGG